jgi:uncharacterized protein YraI
MTPIGQRTLFALAIFAMPAVALAQDAFTLQQTDIYAGPDSEYPQIASLPASTEVGVAGCLSDWSWCDVSFANQRGWVWAGDLGYPYQSGRVPIMEYGARLRLPVVTFSLNTYWDEHYRSRPFYRERSVWVSRVHVEGGHGGRAPHGGTRVATTPREGAQGQQPSAQAGRPQQQAQPAQRPPETAQRQGDQRMREEAAQRQGDQRAREEAAQKAQTEQRNRQQAQRPQPNQPQASANSRSNEEATKSRPQPEASRAQQPPEQRAQAEQRSISPPQRSAQSEARQPAPSEAARAQPDRGTSAKGQNEASRAQPERGASAKGSEEKPKEERQQQ